MSRYTGPQRKLCRREGVNLFGTEQAEIGRKPYPPGQHGQRRQKQTDYGTQLREKQKVRRMYGIQERQFRNYFKKADRLRGVTGENLLRLLEMRLDNVVYRMGFGQTRAHARQLVNHNHVRVNGKKVDIASYATRVGDEISIKEKSRKVGHVLEAMELNASRLHLIPWIEVAQEEFKGVVKAQPSREDVDPSINEQLIVEFYSR